MLHSALEDVARTSAWLAAARGDAGIVLGTRLAVLAPLPKLALIVVDEEHDSSFKQQEGLRYSARDVAVYRAKARGCPVDPRHRDAVARDLAQLAPEALRAARARRARRAGSEAAVVRTVDLRADPAEDGFAKATVAAIGERLARGEQSLVFINRRGYAPVAFLRGLRLGGELRALHGAPRAACRRTGACAAITAAPEKACHAPARPAATSI